jgi:periplasmic divalent cation tolerance protein
MPSKSARYRLIFSTCPNLRVAKRIAAALVGEGLAACVNVVPGLQSVYRWRGKVESAREVLLVIKARGRDYGRIEARIRALHPYELPEVVSVAVASGYSRYLAWIENPEKVR